MVYVALRYSEMLMWTVKQERLTVIRLFLSAFGLCLHGCQGPAPLKREPASAVMGPDSSHVGGHVPPKIQ